MLVVKRVCEELEEGRGSLRHRYTMAFGKSTFSLCFFQKIHFALKQNVVFYFNIILICLNKCNTSNIIYIFQYNNRFKKLKITQLITYKFHLFFHPLAMIL